MTDKLRYYEILGISPDASHQEIRQAYKDLVHVWHPDRFAHNPRLREKAEEKLKLINVAYEHIISDSGNSRKKPAPKKPPKETASKIRTGKKLSDSRGHEVMIEICCTILLFAFLILLGKHLFGLYQPPPEKSAKQSIPDELEKLDKELKEQMDAMEKKAECLKEEGGEYYISKERKKVKPESISPKKRPEKTKTASPATHIKTGDVP